MNNCGFYISQIKFIGENLKEASINFKPGFNFVSGSSNTGKSFILNAIDYMFGKADLKKIPESKGYSDIFLEIHTYDNKIFTLKRDLKGGDFFLAETNIVNFYSFKNIKQLKKKHKANDKSNLSTFLLTLSGLINQNIKTNEKNKKKSLSFRNIVDLIIANETEIISDQSIIFKSNYMEQTARKSILKLIITGKDDTDLVEIPDKKLQKSKIEAQIELLQTYLDEFKEKAKMYKKIDFVKEKIKSDIEIQDIYKEIYSIDQDLLKLYEERKNAWDHWLSFESKLILSNELISRFKLLEKYYKNDLERLEFIEEGDHYLNQLSNTSCVLCGNTRSSIEFYKSLQESQFYQGMEAEANKISEQLVDLVDTIKNIMKENESIKNNIIHYKNLYDIYSKKINDNLNPIKKEKSQKYVSLLQKKNYILQSEFIYSQIDLFTEKLDTLNSLLTEKVKEKLDSRVDTEVYKKISDEVKKTLNDWKFPNLVNVDFDYTNYDFIINKIPRSSNGKGIRAIIYSAFLYALLNYCIKEKLPHPKLIIIDSPVTTYKEKTFSYIKNKDEEIDIDIQHAFFRSLAYSNKDRQIIILENKEPPEELKQKINYIHFSGNPSIGRTGFFPVKTESI